MKYLQINKLLLKNYLQIWDSNFKFTSFISILSLIINSLSVIVIILIFTVNSGFRKNAINIFNDIAGTTKIYSSTNSTLTNQDFNDIAEHNNDKSLSKVIQEKCILKYRGSSETILLNSYNLNESRFNQLSKFIYEGNLTDSTIIIGKLLSEKLNIYIGDKISIINIDNIETIKVDEIIVSGFFSTDFLNFDSNFAFQSIDNQNSYYTYFTSNLDKYNFENNNMHNYATYNNQDMHGEFIKWINSYDNPLKILILFIIIICSINIINNNYYLISNKTKQLYILKTLGMKNNHLRIILLMRSFLFAFVSLIIGSIVSYGLLYAENSLNFIQIPEYVYFTKSLPIDINFKILYIIFPYFFILSFFSLILKYNNHLEE